MYRWMPTAQSRAVSAALLPHCPTMGELTPPPVHSEKVPWATVILGPWPACLGSGSPHALPCSLLGRCWAQSEPQNQQTDSSGPACLVGFLAIHICRGQYLTAEQTLHLTDALSNHELFQWPDGSPLLGWCSLSLCRAVQPWNGTRLHRDLLPVNILLLFSNMKLKQFTSLV